MRKLHTLAELLDEMNQIGEGISSITGRPATIGHTGEFIASHVFDIELQESASNKAIDGYFRSGSLIGHSVNIKWYGKQESILDITPGSLPDFYLVMTGPKSAASTSRGSVRPWLIRTVYLFDALEIVSDLERRGLKIGEATSVLKTFWEAAEIYPIQRNPEYLINEDQKQLLRMFG